MYLQHNKVCISKFLKVFFKCCDTVNYDACDKHAGDNPFFTCTPYCPLGKVRLFSLLLTALQWNTPCNTLIISHFGIILCLKHILDFPQVISMQKNNSMVDF